MQEQWVFPNQMLTSLGWQMKGRLWLCEPEEEDREREMQQNEIEKTLGSCPTLKKGWWETWLQFPLSRWIKGQGWRVEIERNSCGKTVRVSSKEKFNQPMRICKLWAQFRWSYGSRMKRNKSLTCTISRGERNGSIGSPKFQATLAVERSKHGPLITRAEKSKNFPKPTIVQIWYPCTLRYTNRL